MFYVPSLGIYTQMSSPTPVPIFINRTQHFWVITNLMSVMLLQSWFSVFISTSYTKSFVWPQKLKSKGMKSKDRGHHRTGTSQKVSHKRRCSSTKVEWPAGLLQENAHCIVAMPLLNYHVCFAIE
jgi:hypothetical protein